MMNQAAMSRRSLPSGYQAQRGIVLLEVLIAILIFSFGILGLVGLQANMVQANTDAQYRSEATFVVQQRISELWLNQDKLETFGEEGTDISGDFRLPSGTRTTARGCDGGSLSCFTVTVTWQLPGSNEEHRVVTVARIAGG